MKHKLLTNVAYADYRGSRLWCHAVLIDMERRREKEPFADVRQICGLGWGGLKVFTLWIRPDSEVRLHDAESNLVLLSHDGTLKRTLGLVLKATGREGDLVEIRISAESFDSAIVIEDLEEGICPFGDEIDCRILPHATGTAYPHVVWKTIPDKYRTKMAR